jgi:dienelactone hydrolase
MASLLISLNGFSQNKDKKELTANDYHLWSSLRAGQLSESGKWMSFALYYDSGNDTLFVKSTIATTLYNFPGASKGAFIGDKWFSAMSRKGELLITDLATSKQQTVEQVVSYDLRVGTTDIIFMKKQYDGKKLLEIKNVESGNSLVLDNVENYWYNSNADAVVYTTKSKKSTTIALLNLCKKKTTLIASTRGRFDYSDTVWQKNGNSIAFLQQPLDEEKKTARTSVAYYIIDGHKLYTFNPEQYDDFPTDMEVISSSFANLSISKDGKRLFFGLQKTTVPIDPTKVQVWNTSDPFIYPSKVQIDHWDRLAKVAVWWPKEHFFKRITDNEFPKMMLNGDQKKALLFNPQRYEPQANLAPAVDLYLMDLATGDRKLVLQNQIGIDGGTAVSIYKNHVVYFKNSHWWVYDILSGLHKNLTKELGVSFSDTNSDWPEEASPYGNPGWIGEDKTLFVYDQYDIWSIAIDGSSALRLTNGRENQTTYRIVTQSKEQSLKMNYDGTYKGLFAPKDRLLIKTEALEHTGYCFWDSKNGLQPLLDKKMHTSQFIASKKNDSYVYLEENYDTPPRIISKENPSSKEKIFFQSNPQHNKYNWGQSKLIRYTNSKGIVLNGVLFYPSNYNADLKYPMVVHVYEKQFKELYKYVNPSDNNPTGFNISNFTSKGYFVFLPDIIYEIGNPGPSAVDCVVSGTEKAVDLAAIDSTKIGLIGHSYGGYETDYIITQSNLFAAAVAGAAITDYISGYLYVAWDMQKPNFWHYEFGQLRIGKSLYEDYAAYLQNSPIYYADKVNTPLLSWAGEEDYHVHYYQSIEFHLALRRLGKINTMLLYPGEGHVLMQKKYQKDLTQRIEQWFDYYLKDKNESVSSLKRGNITY